MPKTELDLNALAERLNTEALPELAGIKRELSIISPDLHDDIERLLDPEKINDIKDLKEVTLWFFRNLLTGKIPFKMSGELRSWCKDLLPILMAARNPLNIGTGGITVNNTLLQIIQKGEQAHSISEEIVIESGQIEDRSVRTIAQKESIPPERNVHNVVNVPAVPIEKFMIDINDFDGLE